jgi:hypothetical protein
MATEWTQEAINDAFRRIAERATSDPEFRNLALSRPAEAVKEATGKQVPSGVNIRFVDNAGADFTVVLPDAKSRAGELSDAELEQVAGGRGRACAGGLCQPMALSITS